MHSGHGEFKGNKAFLPSKPCARCGRTMTWRKRWANTWQEVRFCSAACRRGLSAIRAREPAKHEP